MIKFMSLVARSQYLCQCALSRLLFNKTYTITLNQLSTIKSFKRRIKSASTSPTSGSASSKAGVSSSKRKVSFTEQGLPLGDNQPCELDTLRVRSAKRFKFYKFIIAAVCKLIMLMRMFINDVAEHVQCKYQKTKKHIQLT